VVKRPRGAAPRRSPQALPDDLLDRSSEEAARLIALSFLDQAKQAAARLPEASDVEALHDFRVAVRRLRSTARAWRGALRGSVRKTHRRALRDLQARTGEARDAEVQRAWLDTQVEMSPGQRAGMAWMRDRLAKRREAVVASAAEALLPAFHALERSLRADLGRIRSERRLIDPASAERFAAAAARSVREHGRALLEQLEALGALEDQRALHETRIAGKRLRYLIEPLRPYVPASVELVDRMKSLQDLLGELNDAHVLCDELGRAMEEAAAERARRAHAATRRGDVRAPARAPRVPEHAGLLELTRRAHERIEDLYARLVDEWSDGAGESLSKAIDALGSELEAAARRGLEIERKYLLRRLPEIPPGAERLEIDQGWLPGDALQERIRRERSRAGTRYLRTLKAGAGVSRLEIEEPTTAALFRRLWPLTAGCRIRKRRHRVPEGDLVWEIDEFLDRPLVIAEVELASPEDKPEPPAWLARRIVREVTDDPRYTNLAIAKRRPKPARLRARAPRAARRKVRVAGRRSRAR
jgi:CHAD domain-containing protein/CYTH domain-containing protein